MTLNSLSGLSSGAKETSVRSFDPPPVKGCVYCTTFLQSTYVPIHPWDSVIEDGAGYSVVPTKGALVPGWLLVVGKKHLLCSAALGGGDFEDFASGVYRARRMVESMFGAATLFENGPSKEAMSIGCGIDHVHMHVVPLRFSLTEAARRMYPSLVDWQPCGGLEQLRRTHRVGTPYIYIEEPNSAPLFAIPRKHSSQMLRRVIAREVGRRDSWDYSRYDGAANAERTLVALRPIGSTSRLGRFRQ